VAADAATRLRLLTPSLDRLAGYAAAIAAGWSADTYEYDVSVEQLAALRQNPDGFLAELTRQGGTIVRASGRIVPKLPSRLYWIDDSEFCGVINLRYVLGSDALPEYVSGHIGYAVVPWKRRRGYATRALALILPVAREVGLRRLEITCYDDNEPSRRVIEKNGGVLTGTRTDIEGKRKLVFHIDLGLAPA
jgi:predicted acetyltransferase